MKLEPPRGGAATRFSPPHSWGSAPRGCTSMTTHPWGTRTIKWDKRGGEGTEGKRKAREKKKKSRTLVAQSGDCATRVRCGRLAFIYQVACYFSTLPLGATGLVVKSAGLLIVRSLARSLQSALPKCHAEFKTFVTECAAPKTTHTSWGREIIGGVSVYGC